MSIRRSALLGVCLLTACAEPARFPAGGVAPSDPADAEGSPVEEDAGTDDDAGVGGGCRSSQICQSFSEAGLELGDLPDDLGQCE